VLEVISAGSTLGEIRLRAFFIDGSGKGMESADPAVLLTSKNHDIAEVKSLSQYLDISDGVRYFRAFPLFGTPLDEEGRRGVPRPPLSWLFVVSYTGGDTDAYTVTVSEVGGKPTLGVTRGVMHWSSPRSRPGCASTAPVAHIS
jgi:hypothetical protein